MRNSNSSFVLVLVLLAVCILIKNEPTTHNHLNKETAPKIRVELVPYTIDYEVQYGSIYTGDQTPMIHRGTITVDGGFDRGDNGLPITGYFPLHCLVHTNDFDLLAPVCSTEVAAFLRGNGASNGVLMTTEVEEFQDRVLYLKSRPLRPNLS